MYYVLVLSLQGASHSSIARPHTYTGYGVFTTAIQRVCVCISNTVPDNDLLIKHVKIFYLTCIFHTCEQWQCQLEKCSDDDYDDDDDDDDDDGDDESSDDDDDDDAMMVKMVMTMITMTTQYWLLYKCFCLFVCEEKLH